MKRDSFFKITLAQLGLKIREKRIEAGLSQTKLAKKAELSQAHIANLERGKLNLTLKTLLAIGDALNCSVRITLEEKDKNFINL